MTGSIIKIKYTGAQASCLISADTAADTLTSKIGVAGAEVVDAAFGTAGVIDLTAAAFDTLQELVAAIEAYTDYTAELVEGEDADSSTILTATVQAKSIYGYFVFSTTSVLNTYALTSWARYREYMPQAQSTDQVAIERLINATTEIGERIAGRHFVSRAWTKDLDGNGRDTLILPEWPITGLTHVYVDSLRVFGADTDIVADCIYYEDEGYIACPDSAFSKGRKNLRAVWPGGYVTVPEEIQLAVVECVKWNLTRLRGGALGIRSITTPDGVNTTYEVILPLFAQRIFESYKDTRL